MLEEEIQDTEELETLLQAINSLKNDLKDGDVFDKEFMGSHTEFDSFEEFIEKTPWLIETQEDFEKIPDEDLDQYISLHTDFSEWELMIDEAISNYLRDKTS